MTPDESFAIFLGFIGLACLTLQSAVLGHDMMEPANEKKDRGIAIRVISLLVLWATWGLFIINYIPWGPNAREQFAVAREAVESISQTTEVNNQ